MGKVWKPVGDTTWESITDKGCTATATDGGQKLTILVSGFDVKEGEDIELELNMDTVRLCRLVPDEGGVPVEIAETIRIALSGTRKRAGSDGS